MATRSIYRAIFFIRRFAAKDVQLSAKRKRREGRAAIRRLYNIAPLALVYEKANPDKLLYRQNEGRGIYSPADGIYLDTVKYTLNIKGKPPINSYELLGQAYTTFNENLSRGGEKLITTDDLTAGIYLSISARPNSGSD